MLSCTGKRSHRHTILHVSFSNSFGLASARPTPQGLSGAPQQAKGFAGILHRRHQTAVTILRAKQLLSAFCYYPFLMAWGGGVFTLHLYCIRHSVIPNWGTSFTPTVPNSYRALVCSATLPTVICLV